MDHVALLVVDVGGSHVKVMTDKERTKREFSSDHDLSQGDDQEGPTTWSRVGYPGAVVRNRPLAEPYNLGRGWAGFDFEKAFGRPLIEADRKYSTRG